MAKPGRNDRCPCGSGNKYKRCCLAKDEEAEHAQREAQGAEQHRRARELEEDVAAWLKRAEEEDKLDDELDDASNAVVDLVKAGKLDDAEAAARDLLVHYPDVHDGWDRLGMIYEARGDNRQAADCYRKVIDFLHQRPDYADPEMAEDYTKLIAKLEPPATI